jgi:hypothetical protein
MNNSKLNLWEEINDTQATQVSGGFFHHSGKESKSYKWGFGAVYGGYIIGGGYKQYKDSGNSSGGSSSC